MLKRQRLYIEALYAQARVSAQGFEASGRETRAQDVSNVFLERVKTAVSNEYLFGTMD